MKDLYAHLHIPAEASDSAIRNAIDNAPPQLRGDAEAVLLSPRRRCIYDRNRNLLNTISELRLHLGLTYTRFWARNELREFWRQPTSFEPKRGVPVDSALIAGAFHSTGRRKGRVEHHGRWILAVAILVAAGAGLSLWLLMR